MVFGENGEIKVKAIGDPLVFNYYPERIEAISFTNHGETYSPPTEHLGVALKNAADPLEIASLGIAFYDEYLRKIEQTFFNKSI
jgi:hypothetical protein